MVFRNTVVYYGSLANDKYDMFLSHVEMDLLKWVFIVINIHFRWHG